MTTAEERVRRLVRGAARLARPDDPLGQSLRAALRSTCPLSREGVELALTRHLEVDPGPGELRALLDGAVPVPRAHVALSAQVFVGALRALAVALAASPDVVVRPSRRDPELTHHLARAAPGLFRVATRLEPRAGDTLWSYGTDAALAAIDRALPSGVRHLAHGPGIGVVVVDAAVLAGAGGLVDLAEAIARDVVPFDQRGCLSPRIALVEGPGEAARELGVELARALERAEREVPCGAAAEEERAAIRRYRDSILVSGELLPAGSGAVSLAPEGAPLVVPPVLRHLHVAAVPDAAAALGGLAPLVTTAGIAGGSALRDRLRDRLPGARLGAPGSLQRPPLDGPVDGRAMGAGRGDEAPAWRPG